MKDKYLILKNNNFLKISMAGFISQMGSSTRTIAIPLFVFLSTKSYMMMSITTILTALPTILLGPLSGKCADKYNKKHLMVLSDVFRGVLDLILFLSISNVYLVVAIGFFMAIGNVFFNPAARAITPNIVKQEDLSDANSIYSLLGNICYLVGPILGGVLNLKVAIIFDAITFITSAILILMVKYEAEEIKGSNNESIKKLGINELINVLKDNRQLEIIVYMTFIMSLAFSMIPVVMPGYVTSILGASKETYSMILSIMCFGGIVGSLINTYINKKVSDDKIYIIGYGLYGLIYGVLCIFRLQYAAIILFFIQGMTMPIMGAASFTIEQKLLDKKIMGRFFGIVASVQALLSIGGRFISGIIAQYIGCMGVFFLAFILMGLGALLGLTKIRSVKISNMLKY